LELGHSFRINPSSAAKKFEKDCLIVPKHFFTDTDTLVFRKANDIKQEVILHKSEFIFGSGKYDLAWTFNEKAVGLVKKKRSVAVLPNYIDIQLNAILERKGKWFYSSTVGARPHQNGEYNVKYGSMAGDCGSPVMSKNEICGMHVGTRGQDVANLFLGIGEILVEIARE